MNETKGCMATDSAWIRQGRRPGGTGVDVDPSRPCLSRGHACGDIQSGDLIGGQADKWWWRRGSGEPYFGGQTKKTSSDTKMGPPVLFAFFLVSGWMEEEKDMDGACRVQSAAQ